jgi:hypothetical protein
MTDTQTIRGVLHVDVAYDWGDEIDLARAATLAPSSAQDLARRPRTPESIAYRPAPLLFPLQPISVEWPGRAPIEARAHATVFDFCGVNVRIDIPLCETYEGWLKLASDQAGVQAVVRQARLAAEPLFQRLLPAIQDPEWKDFYEEYLVFHFDPADVPLPDQVLDVSSEWLAGLLRQEAGPLSRDEVLEALRQKIRYSPRDLVLVDWAGAVVIDAACEETLSTIEFANLQLLEFRNLDQRLDVSLERVYGLVHQSLIRSWRLGQSPEKSLRVLGDLRIEIEVMFERAGNAFQLVGDQYLARLYRLLVGRFHLDDWGQSIRQSLNVVEGVYQILADQVAARRIELMEMIVIVLIAAEILLSLFFHFQ